MQEEGYPHPWKERKRNGKGVAAGRSAQAKRGRLGVPLVARQGRSPSGGLFSLHQRETQRLLCQRFFGQAMRAGTRRAEVDGADTFVNTGGHLIQLEKKHAESPGGRFTCYKLAVVVYP